MNNEVGIVFDSIILDWLLFLLLLLILIGIGCLIRWYYYAKAENEIADYSTESTQVYKTPAFTRRRSLCKRRWRRQSSGKLSQVIPSKNLFENVF